MTKHRYIDKLKQDRWASDIERYERAKNWLARTNSKTIKEHCERVMSEIEKRYPNAKLKRN